MAHQFRLRTRLLITALLLAVTALAVNAQDQEEPEEPKTLGDLRRADLIEQGREAYDNYCGGCHGDEGDGNGPAAQFLEPKPRDFTDAVFKFRSTPSGALPTDGDLHRTITQGVLGTSMPSWYLLPENQKLAIIEYIKTFSEEWDNDLNFEPAIGIPGRPEFLGNKSSQKRGAEVYAEMGCGECHGPGGKGDGPASATLTDDWGRPIKAFDFTSGALKSGANPEDIYRAFSTGLNGTPMPDYSYLLSPDDRWHLISHILKLREEGAQASAKGGAR